MAASLPPPSWRPLPPVAPLRQRAWLLLRATYDEWSRHNAATLAAALAYYTAFAIAPVLILLIAVFGFAFDRAAVQAEAMRQLSVTMGPQAADVVQMLLRNATQPGASRWATTLSVLTILVSSTGVFVEVQRSMDIIWNAAPALDQGIWATLRERILALSWL